MTRTTTGLLAAIALAAPLAAGAATIDVAVLEGGDVELSTFDAPVDEGLLSLAVGYAGADPSEPEGGFEVLAGGAPALAGAAEGLAAPGDGTLVLSFGEIDGALAAAFGGGARVTLDFGGALGPDPLAALAQGGAYEAVSIDLAPIPLPAAGLLLAAALAGLAALRRRPWTSDRRRPA